MRHGKSSQGIFISQGTFLTGIFTAGLWGTKKTFTQLWILLQKLLQTSLSALPDTELSVWRTEKRVKRPLCGSLKSDPYVHGWLSDRETRLPFGGMWSSVQQNSVFKLGMLIFMSFFFYYFYTENCKTCSTSIMPWIQDSDLGPTTISIFLTRLVQSPGSRLGISITNTSSEKKKTLLKCFRKPPFLFYIKPSFWTEQSFLFSYFHLILRLVNRQDHCVCFTCKILFPSEHTHKRGAFSSHFNLIKSQDMFEALSWSKEMNDQGYVSTAVSSKVTALPSVNRSAGNRLESSPVILTK